MSPSPLSPIDYRPFDRDCSASRHANILHARKGAPTFLAMEEAIRMGQDPEGVWYSAKLASLATRALALSSVIRHTRTCVKPLLARMTNRTGRYAAFGHPDTCIRCLCPDGKRRTVRLGVDADTAFSWPGRCSIGGKTVRGFVTGCELMGQADCRFVPYTNQTAKGKARY